MVAVVVGLLVASFGIGISRGMDHKIGWGPANELSHLTNAISDAVYGLNHGYVGFAKVYEALEKSIDIDPNRLDPKDIPKLESKDVLDNAIRAAAAIPELHDIGPLFPPTLETFQQLNLTAQGAEDLGEGAFFSLAFRLFGLRMKSAYYLFFVLIGVSVAAFVAQFRDNRSALALLLFNVLAFHIFFYVPYFQPFVPSVYINRFASTLAIIPAFHFVFLALEGRRATLRTFWLAVLQLGILLFAMFIRSSGTWAILGIVALMVAQWAIAARAIHDPSWRTRFIEAAGAVRFWPALLLLAGFAGFLIYRTEAPHPLYRTFDAQPHHMIWHNAWLGLALNPDWVKYHPEQPGISDSNAFVQMTLAHLRRVGLEQAFVSPYTHQPRIGLHEAYIRLKYLEFVRKHPIYVLKTLLYYKPLAFVNAIFGLFSKIDPRAIFPVFAVIFGIGVLEVGRRRTDTATENGRILSVVGATVMIYAFSLAPIIWAYPVAFVMSDQIWMTTVLVATLAWGAAQIRRSSDKKVLYRPESEQSSAPGGTVEH